MAECEAYRKLGWDKSSNGERGAALTLITETIFARGTPSSIFASPPTGSNTCNHREVALVAKNVVWWEREREREREKQREREKEKTKWIRYSLQAFFHVPLISSLTYFLQFPRSILIVCFHHPQFSSIQPPPPHTHMHFKWYTFSIKWKRYYDGYKSRFFCKSFSWK